jgi:hypothetical protein
MLPLEDLCDLAGKPAQHHIGGVDDEPLALDLAGLGMVGLQWSSKHIPSSVCSCSGVTGPGSEPLHSSQRRYRCQLAHAPGRIHSAPAPGSSEPAFVRVRDVPEGQTAGRCGRPRRRTIARCERRSEPVGVTAPEPTSTSEPDDDPYHRVQERVTDDPHRNTVLAEVLLGQISMTSTRRTCVCPSALSVTQKERKSCSPTSAAAAVRIAERSSVRASTTQPHRGRAAAPVRVRAGNGTRGPLRRSAPRSREPPFGLRLRRCPLRPTRSASAAARPARARSPRRSNETTWPSACTPAVGAPRTDRQHLASEHGCRAHPRSGPARCHDPADGRNRRRGRHRTRRSGRTRRASGIQRASTSSPRSISWPRPPG